MFASGETGVYCRLGGSTKKVLAFGTYRALVVDCRRLGVNSVAIFGATVFDGCITVVCSKFPGRILKLVFGSTAALDQGESKLVCFKRLLSYLLQRHDWLRMRKAGVEGI